MATVTLATVQDYVARSRFLLQDLIEPYRYPDADLVAALNIALLEARRLRPDLFLEVFDTTAFAEMPEFSVVDDERVNFDHQYRMTLVYYMVGHAQLSDDEATQDARAAILLNKFVAQMLEAKS